MCIIISGLKKDIPMEHITKATTQHPDGFGVMWWNATMEAAKVYRTTSAKAFIKRFKELGDGDKVVIHARYATHGKIQNSNCHPFFSPKFGAAMMHNGVISIKTDGQCTDSETYLRYLEDCFNDLDDMLVHKTLVEGDIIGSKFVFMTSNGDIHIFNKHSGVERNNCWYSNSTVFPYEWKGNTGITYSPVDGSVIKNGWGNAGKWGNNADNENILNKGLIKTTKSAGVKKNNAISTTFNTDIAKTKSEEERVKNGKFVNKVGEETKYNPATYVAPTVSDNRPSWISSEEWEQIKQHNARNHTTTNKKDAAILA